MRTAEVSARDWLHDISKIILSFLRSPFSLEASLPFLGSSSGEEGDIRLTWWKLGVALLLPSGFPLLLPKFHHHGPTNDPSSETIDLVDEACANVRVQLVSQPEEIDNLERKRMRLEIELHALEREKDKASKARLVEIMTPLLTAKRAQQYISVDALGLVMSTLQWFFSTSLDFSSGICFQDCSELMWHRPEPSLSKLACRIHR